MPRNPLTSIADTSLGLGSVLYAAGRLWSSASVGANILLRNTKTTLILSLVNRIFTSLQNDLLTHLERQDSMETCNNRVSQIISGTLVCAQGSLTVVCNLQSVIHLAELVDKDYSEIESSNMINVAASLCLAFSQSVHFLNLWPKTSQIVLADEVNTKNNSLRA